MVIEESSVVAAAANAAKFWKTKGGFRAEVLSTEKIGQIHFYWSGDTAILLEAREAFYAELLYVSQSFTEKMKKRGGGILGLEIRTFEDEPEYIHLYLRFVISDSVRDMFRYYMHEI